MLRDHQFEQHVRQTITGLKVLFAALSLSTFGCSGPSCPTGTELEGAICQKKNGAPDSSGTQATAGRASSPMSSPLAVTGEPSASNEPASSSSMNTSGAATNNGDAGMAHEAPQIAGSQSQLPGQGIAGAGSPNPSAGVAGTSNAGDGNAANSGAAGAAGAAGSAGAAAANDNACMPDKPCTCSEGQTKPCGSSIGQCQEGVLTCIGGEWSSVCDGEVVPTDEVCDVAELDEDCDGIANEGCACADGDVQSCGSSQGVCRQGQKRCIGGVWSDTCEGEVKPGTELCDSARQDEDCDGLSNENCACVDGTSEECGVSGVAPCRKGTRTCSDGAWSACKGNVDPQPELCDGVDSDCDGRTDDVDTDVSCGLLGSQVCDGKKCVPHCGDGTLQRNLGEECEPDSTSEFECDPITCKRRTLFTACSTAAQNCNFGTTCVGLHFCTVLNCGTFSPCPQIQGYSTICQPYADDDPDKPANATSRCLLQCNSNGDCPFGYNCGAYKVCAP